MSKNIKIIFTLSFLLNIILVGIILGGIYKPKRSNYFDKASVSSEVREVFKKNMHQNREEMRNSFKEIKAYKDELKAIIIAEKFDEVAYSNTMKKIRDVKNLMSESKAQSLGKTLSTLSQEERKQAANLVLRKLSKKHYSRKKERNYMNSKEKVNK